MGTIYEAKGENRGKGDSVVSAAVCIYRYTLIEAVFGDWLVRCTVERSGRFHSHAALVRCRVSGAPGRPDSAGAIMLYGSVSCICQAQQNAGK
jgi:hypothetical protein